MKLEIIVDNYTNSSELRDDWGLSCLIDGWLLFDTGWHSEIFWHNWKKLGKDIKDVSRIVISHEHYDHTGSLKSILEEKNDIEVSMCRSTSNDFLKELEGLNIKIQFTDEIYRCILDNDSLKIWNTREFLFSYKGKQMAEQALIFKTDKGFSMLCGCSHPGIIELIKAAKEDLEIEGFYLVAGGFHLKDTDENKIQKIVSEFGSLGVKNVAATHCTGKTAMSIFKSSYADSFIEMGAGKTIMI